MPRPPLVCFNPATVVVPGTAHEERVAGHFAKLKALYEAAALGATANDVEAPPPPPASANRFKLQVVRQ